MRRIHSTDRETRDDIADQLARIIWDIHVELMRINPFLVSEICSKHGIDFDFRQAS